jgi:hypothetical protein
MGNRPEDDEHCDGHVELPPLLMQQLDALIPQREQIPIHALVFVELGRHLAKAEDVPVDLEMKAVQMMLDEVDVTEETR